MGASGYVPKLGPIAGEPAGIYLRGDQSHGSQRVYTCMGTNHREPSRVSMETPERYHAYDPHLLNQYQHMTIMK
eukprot:338577-Prorocentrum_minimum.AAC.2